MVSPNRIESPALQKIPSTRTSPRKRIFPEDECNDFIVNDMINIFNNITEKNCSKYNTLKDMMLILCCVDRL